MVVKTIVSKNGTRLTPLFPTREALNIISINNIASIIVTCRWAPIVSMNRFGDVPTSASRIRNIDKIAKASKIILIKRSPKARRFFDCFQRKIEATISATIELTTRPLQKNHGYHCFSTMYIRAYPD